MSINKFLVKKDPVEISLNYIEVEGEAVIIKNKEALSEKALSQIKTIKARFKQPSFQTFSAYIKDAVEPDGEGGSFVNFNKMRENKLRILLLEIEDDDGKVYTVSQNINMLSDLQPEIASTLLDRLETVIDENRYEKMMKMGLFKEEKEKADETSERENTSAPE